MLEKYGLEDINVDMLAHARESLVAHDWRIDLLKRFMHEHYNMNIYVLEKRGLPKIGTVYKLSR